MADFEDPFSSDGLFLDNLEPDPQSETANWLNMSDILSATNKPNEDDFDSFFKQKILPSQSFNSNFGGFNDFRRDLNQSEEESSFSTQKLNSPIKFPNRKNEPFIAKPVNSRLIQLNNNESLDSIAKFKSQTNCTNSEKILKPVEELPQPYRNIFSQFPYFNYVQSQVFDDVIKFFSFHFYFIFFY